MSYSDKKSCLRSKTDIVDLIITITNRLEFSLSLASVFFSSLVPKPIEHQENDLPPFMEENKDRVGYLINTSSKWNYAKVISQVSIETY